MIHHAVWSEGLPDEAVHTASWWHAHRVKLRLQLRHLVHVRSARRVRHAISEEGAPDPHGVEARLREIGAIPPPGGWPATTGKGARGDASSTPTLDVRVVTHSVI